MTNSAAWSEVTKKIFLGVILFVAGGFIYNIVEYYNDLADFASSVGSAMSFVATGEFSGGSSFGFGDVLEYLMLAAVIVGYVMFIMGLGNFRAILNPQDGAAVGQVRLGAILVAVGYVWALLPFLGILSDLLYIAGAIFMLLGYSALKKSTTFPAKAGASNLFLAGIFAIIGYGLMLIPFIGFWLGGLALVVYFIFLILGWSKVKSTIHEAK